MSIIWIYNQRAIQSFHINLPTEVTIILNNLEFESELYDLNISSHIILSTEVTRILNKSEFESELYDLNISSHIIFQLK